MADEKHGRAPSETVARSITTDGASRQGWVHPRALWAEPRALWAEPRGHWAERLIRARARSKGFESRWVDTSLGRLHAFEAKGTGALGRIIAIHGLGSGGMPFVRTLQALRATFGSVCVLESPGHGFSEAPKDPLTPESWLACVHEALDTLLLGSERATLLGNSLGGALSMQYALRQPERLDRMILCSPAGAPLTTLEHTALRSTFAIVTLADARRFIDRLMARSPLWGPLVAPEIRRRLTKPALMEFFERLEPGHFLSAEDLGALTTPTLILWGEGDRILPRSAFEWFTHNAPPSLTCEIMPGVGHCPQIERPAHLARRITAFVSESHPPGESR